MEVKTERDIERWRAGEEEVEDGRAGRAARGEGSHRGSCRGSRRYRGGSYKGGRGDIGQGGPRRPI